MIRLLDINDLPEAIKIASLKPIRGEDTPVDIELLSNSFRNLNTRTLGYFEDGNLITWVMVKFGTLHEEKIWCIVNIFTRNFSNYFTFNGPDIGPIIEKFFAIAEEEGYYSYIYSVPKKLERVYYKKWKSKNGRYDTLDLLFIPANTEPSQNWATRLNGGIRAYDCVIKKRTLKNEYRKENSIDTDKLS